MVQYRRNRVAGGTYFFTVTLQDRTARWLVERIEDLKLSVQTVKRERPFRIDAMVVLPEHLHAVWSLPPDDDDYAGRWRLIKSRFSRALVKAGVGLRRNDKGEYDLWQRRYRLSPVLHQPERASQAGRPGHCCACHSRWAR